MPIESLKDARRRDRVGKLRIGEKKTTKGKEHPNKLDHFVCHEDTQAAANFHEVYGDTPKSLNIVFLSDDMEQVAPQYFMRWGAGENLHCKGTGVTAMESEFDGDEPTGNMKEITCPGEDCPHFKAKPKRCNYQMSLRFALPGVAPFGEWQIDTSGINSIIAANSNLEDLTTFTGGRLRGLPLTLDVVPQKAKPPGMKKKVTIYVLKVRIPASLDELIAKAQEDAPALPAPSNAPDTFPREQVSTEHVPEAATEADTQDEELKARIRADLDTTTFSDAKKQAVRAGLDSMDITGLKKMLSDIAANKGMQRSEEPATEGDTGLGADELDDEINREMGEAVKKKAVEPEAVQAATGTEGPTWEGIF